MAVKGAFSKGSEKDPDDGSVDSEAEALAGVHQREAALRIIFNAWNEALSQGVTSDALASAAVFAAFSDMVGHYGEEAAADIALSVAERVRRGDFTVHRTIN